MAAVSPKSCASLSSFGFPGRDLRGCNQLYRPPLCVRVPNYLERDLVDRGRQGSELGQVLGEPELEHQLKRVCGRECVVQGFDQLLVLLPTDLHHGGHGVGFSFEDLLRRTDKKVLGSLWGERHCRRKVQESSLDDAGKGVFTAQGVLHISGIITSEDATWEDLFDSLPNGPRLIASTHHFQDGDELNASRLDSQRDHLLYKLLPKPILTEVLLELPDPTVQVSTHERGLRSIFPGARVLHNERLMYRRPPDELAVTDFEESTPEGIRRGGSDVRNLRAFIVGDVRRKGFPLRPAHQGLPDRRVQRIPWILQWPEEVGEVLTLVFPESGEARRGRELRRSNREV